MKEQSKTIYVADDGKEFVDKAECEAYEKKLKEELEYTHYWSALYMFDCTEGRGFYKRMVIKTVTKISHIKPNIVKGMVLDELRRRGWSHFDKETTYIMGVQPAPAYIIVGIDAAAFAAAKEGERLGMSTTEAKLEWEFNTKTRTYESTNPIVL